MKNEIEAMITDITTTTTGKNFNCPRVCSCFHFKRFCKIFIFCWFVNCIRIDLRRVIRNHPKGIRCL